MPGGIAPEEAEHLPANILPALGQQYYAELTADEDDDEQVLPNPRLPASFSPMAYETFPNLRWIVV
jgi:hypothetical protein